MAETSRPAFVAGTTARRRNAMRALVGALLLALVSASTASAQATGGAEDNLKQKNIALPPPVTPVANYVPAVRVGNLLFLSGLGRSIHAQGESGQGSFARAGLSGCPCDRAEPSRHGAGHAGKPRQGKEDREGPRHGQLRSGIH